MSPTSRSIPASAELDSLYRAIGFALSQWQFIEAALAKLYVFLLRNNNGAAHTSFFAIGNFYSQLEVVNAAAQQTLMQQKPLLTEWEGLYTRLDRHRKVRNNLAHFSLIVRGDLTEKHVYYLQPTWFDIAHLSEPNPTRYHFKDINSIAVTFEQTSREIENFAKKIAPQQSPPPPQTIQPR